MSVTRTILERLCENGGSLPARELTAGQRSLATRLQSKGLTCWKAPAISYRWACLGQTLFITEKGRAFLSEGQTR